MRNACLLALIGLAVLHAQSDRATLTGTVSDQTGALVPAAPIVVTNTGTGVQFRTQTTETGNYTIPSLPVGTYDLVVEMQGFRRYQQTGIRVQVAVTARIDVILQVGSTAEEITVVADAPLLKSESAEQSTTISGDRINALPLNFAIGQGAVRNPLSFVQLSPGASISGWNDIRVNGAPGNTFRIIFEGQDTTSALNPRVSDESQPSVEAIEEFTLQTSNFSAEFGQVGGGLFNFTSRSGTRQFHGSAYEYLVNEALNAGVPFTNDGSGSHVRPRTRRHNFGASLGGPVIIPKLYNGRDRTFFFANFEMYRNREARFDGLGTVPTEAFRRGDFSQALTGRNLGTDPYGNPIMENTVYDPLTSRTEGGRIRRDPFPGNQIPIARFDPVAARIQDLIPRPINDGLVNNFEQRYDFRKIQDIPSIKVDHNFNASSRMAFYYSRMRTDKDNGQDGLPDPIAQRRDQLIRSHTVRVNYDHTLKPTLLLHLGAGYQRYYNPDTSPPDVLAFDAQRELGLSGGIDTGFPRITGLGSNFGGLGFNMGPSNRNLYLQDKPTGVASLTWVKNNHTYKFGGEWRIDTFTNRNTNGVAGNFVFAATPTGLPALEGQALAGGNVGFPYASFLLGRANSASISNPSDPQYRRSSWGFFMQDTWKVKRNLTLDIGIRYDLQPAADELHYRTSMFGPDIPNPNAGGLPGAMIYAGYGPGRCGCIFTSTYPYGIAPRLGAAYQITPRTVLRAGWGLSYAQLTGFNYIGGGNSQGMGFNTLPFNAPAFGDPAVVLGQGLSYNLNELLGASYDPGLRVTPGTSLVAAPQHIDRNGGRPPRQMLWNVSLQREISSNLVVEAAYVANRGAWFRADGLVNYNAIRPETLLATGLDIRNPADRSLLTSRLDSPQAVARGFTAPYPGFLGSNTVAQSLRPFPQFSGVGSLWAPLGNNWYDSLQVKATKRYSYGLDFTLAYTWSKTLTTVEDQNGETIPVNDVFNRPNQKSLSRTDQPHAFVAGFNYTMPAFGWTRANWFNKNVLGGWTVGGVLRYASGLPIRVPNSNNNLNALLFQGATRVNRVPGQPLFLTDINGKIDPNKEFVFNPNAWSDPGPGEWGFGPAYYGDYRYRRIPDEQLSFGKMFRMRERMSLQIRAEFFNVFNRLVLPNPDNPLNAQATQQVNANGVPTAGFGRINANAVNNQTPRSGQIVARFQF